MGEGQSDWQNFLLPHSQDNYSKGWVRKKIKPSASFSFGDATFSLCLIIENEWPHHICSQSRKPLHRMARRLGVAAVTAVSHAVLGQRVRAFGSCLLAESSLLVSGAARLLPVSVPQKVNGKHPCVSSRDGVRVTLNSCSSLAMLASLLPDSPIKHPHHIVSL